jgi:hypothetical protein
MCIPPERKAPEGCVFIENNQMKLLGDLTDYERYRLEVLTPLMAEWSEQYLALADLKARIHQAMDNLSVIYAGRNTKRKQDQKKSSITVFTLDRSLSLTRKYADRVTYEDVLLAEAKDLIDQCVEDWEQGSRNEMKQLVALSFQRNAKNEFSRAEMVKLRRMESKDPRWKQAMEIIQSAELVDGVASYLLVSVRDDQDDYHPLPLDIAHVRSYRETPTSHEPARVEAPEAV